MFSNRPRIQSLGTVALALSLSAGTAAASQDGKGSGRDTADAAASTGAIMPPRPQEGGPIVSVEDYVETSNIQGRLKDFDSSTVARVTRLLQVDGITPGPSAPNFILFRNEVEERLKPIEATTREKIVTALMTRTDDGSRMLALYSEERRAAQRAIVSAQWALRSDYILAAGAVFGGSVAGFIIAATVGYLGARQRIEKIQSAMPSEGDAIEGGVDRRSLVRRALWGATEIGRGSEAQNKTGIFSAVNGKSDELAVTLGKFITSTARLIELGLVRSGVKAENPYTDEAKLQATELRLKLDQHNEIRGNIRTIAESTQSEYIEQRVGRIVQERRDASRLDEKVRIDLEAKLSSEIAELSDALEGITAELLEIDRQYRDALKLNIDHEKAIKTLADVIAKDEAEVKRLEARVASIQGILRKLEILFDLPADQLLNEVLKDRALAAEIFAAALAQRSKHST